MLTYLVFFGIVAVLFGKVLLMGWDDEAVFFNDTEDLIVTLSSGFILFLGYRALVEWKSLEWTGWIMVCIWFIFNIVHSCRLNPHLNWLTGFWIGICKTVLSPLHVFFILYLTMCAVGGLSDRNSSMVNTILITLCRVALVYWLIVILLHYINGDAVRRKVGYTPAANLDIFNSKIHQQKQLLFNEPDSSPASLIPNDEIPGEYRIIGTIKNNDQYTYVKYPKIYTIIREANEAAFKYVENGEITSFQIKSI